MAEKLRFIDTIEYDSAEYAEVTNVGISDGVAPDYLNELEVVLGSGLQIIVKDGAMTSKGRTYIQDELSDGASPLTLSIDAATTGYSRKDVVVIEYDIDDGEAAAKIAKGTEASSDPEEPTWTDSSTLWKVKLAVVNVDGGSIDSITDERTMGGARAVLPEASEETKGIIEIADESETTAGTVDNKAVPPIHLATVLEEKENTLDSDQKRKITISDDAPASGDGADGDVWFEY